MNVNDNVDNQLLSEFCQQHFIGDDDDVLLLSAPKVSVKHHPKTHKHLHVACIQFAHTKQAKRCLQFSGRTIMGDKVMVVPDNDGWFGGYY